MDWHSTLIRDLEAMADSWESEADGYGAAAVAADPVLFEHCGDLTNAAKELRVWLDAAKAAEDDAMDRLAAELRDVETHSRRAAADRLMVLAAQPEVAALVEAATDATNQWRGYANMRRAGRKTHALLQHSTDPKDTEARLYRGVWAAFTPWRAAAKEGGHAH